MFPQSVCTPYPSVEPEPALARLSPSHGPFFVNHDPISSEIVKHILPIIQYRESEMRHQLSGDVYGILLYVWHVPVRKAACPGNPGSAADASYRTLPAANRASFGRQVIAMIQNECPGRGRGCPAHPSDAHISHPHGPIFKLAWVNSGARAIRTRKTLARTTKTLGCGACETSMIPATFSLF